MSIMNLQYARTRRRGIVRSSDPHTPDSFICGKALRASEVEGLHLLIRDADPLRVGVWISSASTAHLRLGQQWPPVPSEPGVLFLRLALDHRLPALGGTC